MLWLLIRRCAIFLASALVASLLIFWVLDSGCQPAQLQLGVNGTPEAVQALCSELGLDRPLLVQYGDWLGGMLHGDFGVSYVSKAPIGATLFDQLAVTLWLVAGAMVVALVIAVPLGMLAALRNGRPVGYLLSGVSQLGVAVPAFLAAILLVLAFAVNLGWFPANGYVVPAAGFGDFVRHMALPWVSLGVVQGAVLARYVRSAVLDEMGQDYLRTARAKGLTPLRALARHGLRNASIPVLTVIGVNVVTVLVGAVVIERIFTIPGIGKGLADAAERRDLLTVQAQVMVLVVVALLISLLVDIAYTLIDPRLRTGGAAVTAPQTGPAAQPVPELATAAPGAAARRAPVSPLLVIGAVLVAFIAVAALVSFFWTPFPLLSIDYAHRSAGPGVNGHWLGTDRLGRDIASRLMVGAQTTLYVGIVAVGIAALIGAPLGILAGMTTRGWSQFIMRGNDILLAFPALLVAIILAARYGGSVTTAMIAIGIASIPGFVRVIRSGTLRVMSTDYVLAARIAGRGPFAVAVRHVLPNVAGLLIVQASSAYAIAILAEAGLSFLGLGAPSSVPSWGRMLFEAQSLLTIAPLTALWPGLAIALAVLGFNLLGDGLRDRLDPQLLGR